MGGGLEDGARTDAAQFADVAVFVATVPDRGDTRHTLLAPHAAFVLFRGGVRGDVRVVVHEHRAIQGAALAGGPKAPVKRPQQGDWRGVFREATSPHGHATRQTSGNVNQRCRQLTLQTKRCDTGFQKMKKAAPERRSLASIVVRP